MLIALVLAYFFFGGSGGALDFGRFYTEQAKSLIKAEVSDSERKKSALESAESAKKAIEAMGKQMEKNSKRMKKLYEDYSSAPEEWNAAIQQGLDAEQLPFYDFVHARQALLKSVTPQEWSAIVADAKRRDEAAAAKVAEKTAK
jgi:hypothetical protein